MEKASFDLDEIPQANDLEKVGLAVVAVSKGNSTYQQIAEYIGFTERQGRYYRRAAEILGLIKSDGRNNSVLTDAGQAFITATKREKNLVVALKPSLLGIPLLREVYERVSNTATVDDADILECLIELSGVKKSNVTIVRRLSTFVSWLKQAGLLEETDDEQFRLLPIVVKAATAPRLALDENNFLKSVTPYLYIPKEEEETNWDALLEEYKKLSTANQKSEWLKDEDHLRFARYVVGISSKEKVDIPELDRHIADLCAVDKTHARLLVERNRSLRFVSKAISTGGTSLEDYLEAWLTSHQLEFKRPYLLKGSEKNVDFYVPSLNLAIESKFSKTSGTKHSGAIHDLNEIAKARKFSPSLVIGVALAGEGFESGFFSSLNELHAAGNLDFVLPVTKVNSTAPRKIVRQKSLETPSQEDLKFDSRTTMTWSEPLSEYEEGLYDAIFWLKKYSAVSYLSFTAKLQTWINQTPFAIECLRLILGWSQTQLENFVLSAVPEGIEMLKSGEINSEQVSLLVAGMNRLISPEELSEIEHYFDSPTSISDFIAARIEAFDGMARKKKNTSKVFVEACKAAAPYSTLDETVDLELPNATNLQSNFAVRLPDGSKKNVICKYYAGDGSVMSDLVKKLEQLAASKEVSNWIVIVDGAGWRKRIADFRRLLAIAKDTKLELYNLHMWKAVESEKRLKA